jgi:hypothetical protein
MIVLARNEIREVEPDVFAVTLTQGRVALVDRADLETIAAHRWYAGRDRRTFYAQRIIHLHDGSRTTIRMHRFLMPDAEEVDHVNGDGLDNRRANLRVASRSDNKRNERKRLDNTSGFKGVHWDSGHMRWRAKIMVDGKNIRLGRFHLLEEAARAYDAAARVHFGTFAALNFPVEGERAAIEMAS